MRYRDLALFEAGKARFPENGQAKLSIAGRRIFCPYHEAFETVNSGVDLRKHHRLVKAVST